MDLRLIVRLLVVAATAASLAPGAAQAGCGCDRRPPRQAVIRPRFASAGWPIILFHPSLVPDRAYDVAFIRYIALDLHRVLDPTIIKGLAYGEPNRRLLPEHVIGYNAQGYMFSTLDALPKDSPVFKWEIVPSDGQRSDMLRYWRHSFHDWASLHDEHRWGPKRNAPDDSYYWHVDGTPHVDHNLWVVAIKEDFFRARRQPWQGSPRRVIRLNLRTRPSDGLD